MDLWSASLGLTSVAWSNPEAIKHSRVFRKSPGSSSGIGSTRVHISTRVMHDPSAVPGRVLSRRDLVPEVVRIQTIQAAVDRFGLGIHEEADRRTGRFG